MYIVKPFGGGLGNLVSAQPPMERRLTQLVGNQGQTALFIS
ncbi:uncharacterized protein METZ01_LOCUS361792 [marine metagenome]|uniref:Uncharacterized protein n=1 Tax=marine metagenome TaxID=408172 RepID=A0A382SID1_9ZZZZ